MKQCAHNILLTTEPQMSAMLLCRTSRLDTNQHSMLQPPVARVSVRGHTCQADAPAQGLNALHELLGCFREICVLHVHTAVLMTCPAVFCSWVWAPLAMVAEDIDCGPTCM